MVMVADTMAVTAGHLPFSATMAWTAVHDVLHDVSVMTIEVAATDGPGPWEAVCIGHDYVLWRCTKQAIYLMTGVPPRVGEVVNILRFGVEPGNAKDRVHQTSRAFGVLYPMFMIERHNL